MPEKPEFTYHEALRSFDGAPESPLNNGGRALLRAILKIGLREGVKKEEIARDVAHRLGITRKEVEDAIAKCERKSSGPGLGKVIKLVQPAE